MLDIFEPQKQKLQLADEEAAFFPEKSDPLKRKPRGKFLLVAIGVSLFLVMLEFMLFGYLVGSSRRPNNAVIVKDSRKKLLLISIDGFRFDYIMRGLTPNLAALARDGYMSRLVPQFPSYTFPNHFSIVTGLYPESHGIVSNSFYDPRSEKFFYFTNTTTTMNSNFWNAEPVWNTNQAQGGKSAVLHYPGSDVAIAGKRPSLYQPFTDQISSKGRTKVMLDWIDNNADVNLSILYFDEVDHAGHVHGPNSPQVNASLKSVDTAIGDFIGSLKRRDIYNDYNIMIVSDHGMTQIDQKKRIYFEKYIPKLKEMVVWSDFGPVASMIPKEKYKYRLSLLIRRAIQKYKLPVRLYTKATMPTAYHYSKNERIPSIVLEAKQGWTIDDLGSAPSPVKGIHGYGRSVRDMDGIFIGHGPSFSHHNPPMYPFQSNLDAYPLMCELLGIEPRPHNGTFKLSSEALGRSFDEANN